MTGETRNQSQRGPVRCTLSFPKPINTVSSPVRGHIHARMSSRLADFDLRCDTLVDLLRTRAAREGDRPAYIFLEDGGGEETRLGFAELDRRARSVAATLQSLTYQGERALLLYPQGLDYMAAF